MQRLSKAIKSVFKNFDESQFNLGLEMGQIPGWDSMNSINLQLEVESRFNIKFGDFTLNDYNKVIDIVNFLKEKWIELKE